MLQYLAAHPALCSFLIVSVLAVGFIGYAVWKAPELPDHD